MPSLQRLNFNQPCSCGGSPVKGRQALLPQTPVLESPSPKPLVPWRVEGVAMGSRSAVCAHHTYATGGRME